MKYLLLHLVASLIVCFALYLFSGRFNARNMNLLLSKCPGPVLLGISLTIVIAFMLRFAFVQDDAYISFRYSENLAIGNGLTWNPGDKEPVQGYTNFLWVILMSAPLAFGLNIEYSAIVIGIFLGLLTICFTYFLSFNAFHNRSKAIFPVILLSTNYSFLSYATGGLETQLATLSGIMAWYLATLPTVGGLGTFSFSKINRTCVRASLFIAISVIIAIAYLTRMDTLLITGMCMLFLVVKIFRQDCKTQTKLIYLAALIIPFVSIAACHYGFMVYYYGSFLPNTFYIKAKSFSYQNLTIGGFYIAQFFLYYGLASIIVIVLLARKRILPWNRSEEVWLYMLISVCLTIFYSLRVGGDFMEFRFFVPIMPIIFLLLAKEIILLGPRFILMTLFSLPIFSAANAYGLIPRLYGIESFSQLQGHLYNRNENWIGIGKKLKSIFPVTNGDLIIGVTPAGAIPYYSRLKSVDLLGLNDRFIAKDGVVIGSRPGHTKGPTLDYLYQSKINLLIGHPQVRLRDEPFSENAFMLSFCWFMKEEDCKYLLRSRPKILTMALDDDYILDMIYLTPSRYVEKALSEGRLVLATKGQKSR